MDSFLKSVVSGDFSASLTKRSLKRGDGDSHQGSGYLAWRTDGCELKAVTDGGNLVQREFGQFQGEAGKIMTDAHYLSLKGTTQDGWDVCCQRLDNSGLRHKVMHGHSAVGDETMSKLQSAVDDQGILANLINKMVLQAAGYSGDLFDYTSYQPVPFTATDLKLDA